MKQFSLQVAETVERSLLVWVESCAHLHLNHDYLDDFRTNRFTISLEMGWKINRRDPKIGAMGGTARLLKRNNARNDSVVG